MVTIEIKNCFIVTIMNSTYSALLLLDFTAVGFIIYVVLIIFINVFVKN